MPNTPPEQNVSNYTRLDPKFHFIALPIFAITAVGTIVHAVQIRDILHLWLAILACGALLSVFMIRTYSLKVQDRVIRLEERLRLRDLASESLRSRIPELSMSQLIALRFASDGEVCRLAERAVNEKLDSKQIKAAIQTWRPDFERV